jgi:hypothetical protein
LVAKWALAYVHTSGLGFGLFSKLSKNPSQLLNFWQKGKQARACYDHNFLRFFPSLGEKMVFFLNTNVMIH